MTSGGETGLRHQPPAKARLEQHLATLQSLSSDRLTPPCTEQCAHTQSLRAEAACTPRGTEHCFCTRRGSSPRGTPSRQTDRVPPFVSVERPGGRIGPFAALRSCRGGADGGQGLRASPSGRPAAQRSTTTLSLTSALGNTGLNLLKWIDDIHY